MFFSGLRDILLEVKPHGEREEGGFRIASVLVPLVRDVKDISVVLSTRTERVPHHKGQVCFPGGSRDEEDTSLVGTALREAREELGILEKDVELLGELPPVPTMTDFLISPYVGILPGNYPFMCDEYEVEEVFQAPLSIFLQPERYRTMETFFRGEPHPVYFFDYNEKTIWGATAKILRRLADLIIDGGLQASIQ